MNYYFFGTLLPELHVGEKPEIGHREFEQLARDNLSNADYAKVITIRNFYDIPNLLAYWLGEPLDPLGSLDHSGMEEALVTRQGLPSYIYNFMDKYESKEERIKHYPEMFATFFQHEIAKHNGAVKQYLILERDMRLILVAFRAKQLGRDIYKEMQYENPEDELVAQILAQKDSQEYEPPEKYEDVKKLLIEHADNPIALHKALLDYRFNRIENILGLDMFSIDRILGYMVELIMVEKWLYLSKEKGQEIVDKLLKEAS